MLNYAELRIQRDLDLTAVSTAEGYTTNPAYVIPASSGNVSIPIDDWIVINSIDLLNLNGSNQVISTSSLIPVSIDYIHNCCNGLSSSGTPKYFCVTGDNYQSVPFSTVNWTIRVGPSSNKAWPISIRGLKRQPSLYKYASPGIADTSYTYISTYYPDMLMMASMIYVSAFQRNFSATSDDPQMPMNYEKQYQALRLGAIPEENRKKQQGSGWTAFSTPVSATPTR